jgi:hypothetical protein
MGFGASWVRHVVGNKSAKLDPPEIYNWRVFALACAVSSCPSYSYIPWASLPKMQQH